MTERTNARYEGGWYFCWLIERSDGPQPTWFTADCTWTTNAHEALWWARKEDAEASAGECLDDARVVEHGFAIEPAAERTCEWIEVEADSGLFNTCKEGEEFQLTDGLDLWPHCHLCGGKIVIGHHAATAE